jgi:4-hydroxybenzoate polyprenyltransferase
VSFEGLLRRLTPPGRQIAGTVYGTIVVMGALVAGSKGGEPDPATLAAAVAGTVLVLWLAHVYSHALGETIALGRRLDAGELRDVARRELAIPLAAVAPLSSLLLGAAGVFRDTTSVWIALLIGLATLAVHGLSYARIERLSPVGTLVVVAINLGFGLALVALKAGLTH